MYNKNFLILTFHVANMTQYIYFVQVYVAEDIM